MFTDKNKIDTFLDVDEHCWLMGLDGGPRGGRRRSSREAAQRQAELGIKQWSSGQFETRTVWERRNRVWW